MLPTRDIHAFTELRRLRADELILRAGISEREAFDLIDAIGFDRSALMREARVIAEDIRRHN